MDTKQTPPEETTETKVDFIQFFTDDNLKLSDILEWKDKICSNLKNWRKFEKIVENLEEKLLSKMSETKASTRKGIAYWILNRTDEAIQILENAPINPERNFFLARAYLDKNFYSRASELLEPLYKNMPDILCVTLSYIEAKLGIGQAQEMLPILEKLYKQYRDNPDVSYYTGLCYEYLGDYSKAAQEYQYALRLNPNHPRTLFRIAYRLALEGRDEEALNLYEKLAEMNPTYINVMINLGLLYEDFRQYDRAVQCYQTVLAFQPTHPRARLYLKDVISAQKMYYDEETKRREIQLQRILATPVTDFHLSVRSRETLAKLGIKTLGDLVKKTEQELLACDNFGIVSLNELKEILARYGLSFAPERVAGKEDLFHLKPAGLEEKLARAELLYKPISDFEWSARVRSCFQQMKIYTIGDLVNKTEGELLANKNFGQVSLREIKQRLASLGLSLRVAKD